MIGRHAGGAGGLGGADRAGRSAMRPGSLIATREVARRRARRLDQEAVAGRRGTGAG
ncbi:MAG: hypothetical protein MZV65_52125 [Chromatiales bacterium]|nr:hypothetical protein [Chromatiales bacterium]